MSLRVGKYNWELKAQPVTAGYTNVLVHTNHAMSPYVLRDDQGHIMENAWQFSKLWPKTPNICTSVSRWSKREIRWAYNETVFVDEDHNPNDAYWAWRHEGMTWSRWVRYPVGYKHHNEALCSIVGTPLHYEKLDYIQARKQIYYRLYRDAVVQTLAFKKLKQRFDTGESIQINEVDGPSHDPASPPFDQVIDGSLQIHADMLQRLIENPSQPFGHGYALAGALIGWNPEP